jgi:hypothetical protein
MKDSRTPYDDAHLFVAAIRVLTHQRHAPPSVEDVCKALSHTSEWGSAISRRLEELGIVNVAQTPFGTRLFIADHLRLEKIPRVKQETGFGAEIEAFRKGKQEFTRKIEGIQAEAAKRKKELFSELEKKLKKEGD